METFVSKDMKRLNYLISEIDSVYHAISLKMGISDSVMKVLYTICDNGDSCLLQEICQRSGVSKQTINSAVRKLEAEGIIYLEPAGAKSKKVCLTDGGRQLAERTALRIIAAENEILASWSEKDVETYLSLTERFLSAVKEQADRL